MALKYAILAALSSRPGTGYELANQIDGSVAYFWSSTHQQIYKELKDLDRAGWVAPREVIQSDKPDKKVYRLTAAGLKELKAWISQESEMPPAKDALLIKIFAGHLVPVPVLLEVLEKATLLRKARLKRYQEIVREHFTEPKSLPVELQYRYLTLRRGIGYEKAWLSWATETREFLEARA